MKTNIISQKQNWQQLKEKYMDKKMRTKLSIMTNIQNVERKIIGCKEMNTNIKIQKPNQQQLEENYWKVRP